MWNSSWKPLSVSHEYIKIDEWMIKVQIRKRLRGGDEYEGDTIYVGKFFQQNDGWNECQ